MLAIMTKRASNLTNINMDKKSLIALCLILCCIAFCTPMIFISSKDTDLTVLSAAFTAMACVATVIMLIIAILLYQRFGIESRFVEKQVDKVLELVDVLKGRYVTVSSGRVRLYLRHCTDNGPLNTPIIESIYSKNIIWQMKDYDDYISPILNIKKSYWLPKETKDLIDPIDFRAFIQNVDNPESAAVAKVLYGKQLDTEIWAYPINQITVYELMTFNNDLVLGIEDWLSKHSKIKLDLKFEEEKQE